MVIPTTIEPDLSTASTLKHSVVMDRQIVNCRYCEHFEFGGYVGHSLYADAKCTIGPKPCPRGFSELKEF